MQRLAGLLAAECAESAGGRQERPCRKRQNLLQFAGRAEKMASIEPADDRGEGAGITIAGCREPAMALRPKRLVEDVEPHPTQKRKARIADFAAEPHFERERRELRRGLLDRHAALAADEDADPALGDVVGDDEFSAGDVAPARKRVAPA